MPKQEIPEEEKVVHTNATFGEAFYNMAKTFQNTATYTVDVKWSDDDNKFNIVIEAHEPCDKEYHENCRVVGFMAAPVGTDYQTTVDKARPYFEIVSKVVGNDRVQFVAKSSINN